VPEPGLHEGDVGGVLEGVGRGGRSQGVQAQSIEVDAGRGAVAIDEFVDPVSRDGGVERAGRELDRSEQRAGPVVAVAGQPSPKACHNDAESSGNETWLRSPRYGLETARRRAGGCSSHGSKSMPASRSVVVWRPSCTVVVWATEGHQVYPASWRWM